MCDSCDLIADSAESIEEPMGPCCVVCDAPLVLSEFDSGVCIYCTTDCGMFYYTNGGPWDDMTTLEVAARG